MCYPIPILSSYLTRIKEIAHYGGTLIDNSLVKLSRMMLVTDLDKYTIHPSISAYFDEELRQTPNKSVRDSLLNQLIQALTEDVENELKNLAAISSKDRNIQNQKYITVTRQLFVLTAPLQRLAWQTKQGNRTKHLPYQRRGLFRRLALEAYRSYGDYEGCIEFAKRWLDFDPDDTEVKLEMARAYRQLGKKSFDEASKVLDELESIGGFTTAQVLRERGLICYQEKDWAKANEYYKQSLAIAPWYRAARESYIRSLRSEANRLHEGEKERIRLYNLAADQIEYLMKDTQNDQGNQSKDITPDLYVDIMVGANRIKQAEGIKILEEALTIPT